MLNKKPQDPLLSLLLTAFLTSVILFFSKWRTTEFNTQEGAGYLFFIFIVVLALLYTGFGLQKLVAKKLKYGITYKPNTNLLLISVLVGFLSRGYLFLLFLGDVPLKIEKNMRLGVFRNSIHLKDLAIVSMVLPLFTLLVGLITGGVYAATQNMLVYEIMKMSLFIALFALIPCAKNMGVNIYFWNKKIHLLILIATLLFTALLVLDLGIFVSLILSLFVGLFIGFLEYLPKLFYS